MPSYLVKTRGQQNTFFQINTTSISQDNAAVVRIQFQKRSVEIGWPNYPAQRWQGGGSEGVLLIR
jgi:hypothetical protein